MKTAEEILSNHTGYQVHNKIEIISAMEEYKNQGLNELKPSDEEIEKYYDKMFEQKPVGSVTNFGFVAGAKAMRDNPESFLTK